MARVHHRKAAKDYPDNGIKKGDMYYFAQIKTGPRSSRTIRSLTKPKRWQLTSSEFLSAVYQLEDRIGELTNLEDVDEIVNDLRSLAEETRERFENMPEGLQMGDTGQMLETRAEGCDEAADEIEDIAQNVDLPDEDDYEDDNMDEYEDDCTAATDDAVAAINEVQINYE